MSASDTLGNPDAAAVKRDARLMRWRWLEDSGLVVVFIAMLLAIGIPYPEFFSFGSVKTILRQSALVGIIAFGMVYLVAMVEIDLSVGGIFAVAGSLSALLIKFHHVDPWIAVGLALVSGILLGAAQRGSDQPAARSAHHCVARHAVRLFRPASGSVRRQGDLRPAKGASVLPDFRQRLVGTAGIGLDRAGVRDCAVFRFHPDPLRRDGPRDRLESGSRRIHRRAHRPHPDLRDRAGRISVRAVRHHDARLLQGRRYIIGPQFRAPGHRRQS